MEIISLNNIWLKYRVEFKVSGKVSREDFLALKGIQFSVKKGECVAILGENGAGKTTLLKIISGMLKPDKGSLMIHGKIAVLMEIGAGFQKELTGGENIYLISSLFGLSRKQIEAKYEDIVNFAALGRFINAPVKSYSQGMYMRLAFAIAIHVEPDILLVDDIFAVGDVYAQRKCIDKMFELRQRGKTIVFVTHDIEMARRLCARGIFIREGKVIKDGAIEEVCSCYVESVGNKEGIAILQRGSLGVIFNNGKLILKWNEKTITCNSAGYSRLISSGREYLSNTAYWGLSEGSIENEIIAIGRWPDLPVNLQWKITLLNEREFLWEIILLRAGTCSIEKFNVELMLKAEFRKWFALDREVSFPSYFMRGSRVDLTTLDDSINKIIGVKGFDGEEDSFPSLLFERLQDDTATICRVGNTGADLEARLIHYQPLLSLSEKNEHCNCFLYKVTCFDAKDKSVQLYLDNARTTRKDSIVIRKGALTVSCYERKVQVYYHDQLLTHSTGLMTRFKCQDDSYNAQQGHWIIRRENNEKIVVTLFWDRIPQLVQVWELSLQDNNVITWKIEMEVKEKVKIRQQQSELMLSNKYAKWLTPDEKGNFQGLDKQGKLGILNNYINKYIGVEDVCGVDTSCTPGVVFSHKCMSPLASYFSKIKEDEEITRLFFVAVDEKKHSDMGPGTYKYFEGEIKVGFTQEALDLAPVNFDKGCAYGEQRCALPKLETGRLSLVFEHGKIRLFWRGLELTKRLGLYSSMQYNDIWCDSAQAVWSIEQVHQNKLVAVGSWPWIPLIQYWDITLLNENSILWNIELEVWEHIILQKGQVNLMLSDAYKEWFVEKKIRGEFSRKFMDHNGIFWDRLWCGDTSLPIGVKGVHPENNVIPPVTFVCQGGHQDRYFVIENTDTLFQSRVLQCEVLLNNGFTLYNDKENLLSTTIVINE